MGQLNVAICICTYRRPSQLDQLLGALADQTWTRLAQPAITAFVVENEPDGPAEEICEKHATQGKLGIRYAVEPRPGVPVARNRCLDMAVNCSDFIAIIDDDELPAPDWLEQLLLLQFSTNADAVVGPVLPSYLVAPSAWLVRGRFHDSRPPDGPGDLFGTQPRFYTEAVTSSSDAPHASIGTKGLRFTIALVQHRQRIIAHRHYSSDGAEI